MKNNFERKQTNLSHKLWIFQNQLIWNFHPFRKSSKPSIEYALILIHKSKYVYNFSFRCSWAFQYEILTKPNFYRESKTKQWLTSPNGVLFTKSHRIHFSLRVIVLSDGVFSQIRDNHSDVNYLLMLCEIQYLSHTWLIDSTKRMHWPVCSYSSYNRTKVETLRRLQRNFE